MASTQEPQRAEIISANDSTQTTQASGETKKPKPKSTFMLHDPKTFASLGKYISTDARYSALKAASRGIADIYLRKTNSKIIYHYQGSVVTLDEPQVVMRGKRKIEYTKKPIVKFLKKFVYEGDVSKLDAQEISGEDEKKKTSKKNTKKQKTEDATQEDANPPSTST